MTEVFFSFEKDRGNITGTIANSVNDLPEFALEFFNLIGVGCGRIRVSMWVCEFVIRYR